MAVLLCQWPSVNQRWMAAVDFEWKYPLWTPQMELHLFNAYKHWTISSIERISTDHNKNIRLAHFHPTTVQRAYVNILMGEMTKIPTNTITHPKFCLFPPKFSLVLMVCFNFVQEGKDKSTFSYSFLPLVWTCGQFLKKKWTCR